MERLKAAHFQNVAQQATSAEAFAETMEAEETAIEMLRYSEAFSRFCAAELPDSVRFSIREYSNAGPKFALNLVGLAQVEYGKLDTPYHSVGLRLRDNRVVFVKR